MIKQPKVSIVIPVYNGANYLRQAIESALGQTYENIEIIVVNDGSNDLGATEEIALSFGEKIRYFSKPNGGVASALNKAIKEMSGEYFSWLSHDDLYYPEKIAYQINAASEEPNKKTIFYGDFAVFSDDANSVTESQIQGVPPEHFRYYLTIKNELHGCTLLIPKTAFDDCGLFDESLRTTQDYDLWFRMACEYRFIHLPKLLVKARHHAEQGSVKMNQIALRECDVLLENFINNLNKSEIIVSTKSSIIVSYAKLAASMQYRGFTKARQSASQLALAQFGRGQILDDVKAAVILLRVKYIDLCISYLRKIVLKLR